VPDGSLEFKGLSPAGGSFPRQFALNKAGDLVGVGLQQSSRVVLYSRDVETGKIADVPYAHVGVEGQVDCVVWDE
jgi:6-phosphogluconolactonase (cycloisomerase 2 family)